MKSIVKSLLAQKFGDVEKFFKTNDINTFLEINFFSIIPMSLFFAQKIERNEELVKQALLIKYRQ